MSLCPTPVMHVSDSVELLVQASLIRRLDAEATYLFKHVLIQDAAHKLLLLGERRELHRRVLGIYESAYAAQKEEYAALLAFHSAEAGDDARAISYLELAGEHAARMGAYVEAVAAYTRALELGGAGTAATPNAETSARLLIRRGDLHCRYNRYAQARDDLNAALNLAGTVANAALASRALSGLAHVATQQGEHRDALALGERALEYARAGSDNTSTARALRGLGVTYNLKGDNGAAEKALLEALALYRALGDREGAANCLNSLAIIRIEQNDLEASSYYLDEALALSRALNDRYSISIRLANQAVVAEKRGDLERARQLQEESLALSREIGDEQGVAFAYLNLGTLALERDDQTEAERQLCEAFTLARDLGSYALALYVVAACARLARAQGHLRRAAELMALALEHPASTADIQADFGTLVEDLRMALSEPEFHRARERGRALDLSTLNPTEPVPAPESP